MNDHERSDGVHDLDRAVVCASLNNNHVDVEDLLCGEWQKILQENLLKNTHYTVVRCPTLSLNSFYCD